MTPVHVHQDENKKIQTSGHKTAPREDLKNDRILSPPISTPLIEFFNAIKEDFTILIDNLLLYMSKDHKAVSIDIAFSALYHRKQTLVNQNKIIAEVKNFNLYKMVITIFHHFLFIY